MNEPQMKIVVENVWGKCEAGNLDNENLTYSNVGTLGISTLISSAGILTNKLGHLKMCF